MAEQLCDSAKANRILAAMLGSLEPEDVSYVVGLMRQDEIIDDDEAQAVNQAATVEFPGDGMAGDSAMAYDARVRSHVLQTINKRLALHRTGQIDESNLRRSISPPPRTDRERQAFDAMFPGAAGRFR